VAVDEFEIERQSERENAAAAGKVFRRSQQKSIGISTGLCAQNAMDSVVLLDIFRDAGARATARSKEGERPAVWKEQPHTAV
jgi:hypothetical protein